MKGTYYHDLGAGVFARVSYSYQPPERSWDYDQPDDPASCEITKIELENEGCSIDITSCIEELCDLSIDQLEEKILIDKSEG